MENTPRTHRVGTLTAGICLIAGGILFFLKSFELIPLDYLTILSLWPVILIGLGLELLLSHFRSDTFIYDKGAIGLLVFMGLFAFCLGGIQIAITELIL